MDKPWLIILIILAIILFILLNFYILLSIMYKRTFYSSPKRDKHSLGYLEMKQMKPYKSILVDLLNKANEIPYEKVTIKSFDGLTLSARLYVNDPKAPFDILVHGYKSYGIKDFSGGINLSLENHHNILLIDHRGHGYSEGKTISFGILERFDILSWINFLNERFGKDIPIILMGISMGGATVLMASELDLPSNVKLVIADCPFSSAMDIIRKVAKENKYPLKIVDWFMPSAAKLFGKFDLFASSALTAVKNAKVPILLIHGDEDDFVPYEMSVKISKANPAIEFHTFKCNIHGLSYIFAPDEYKKIVREFNEKHLN